MATNILSVLGVDSLALRGYQTEYNRFSRFFKNEAEAVQAVTTGDYVPVPGISNLVIIGGLGIMLWSFDLQNFIGVAELQAAGNQANKYILIDGANDHVQFDALAGGSEAVFDLSKDFSFGVTMVGLGNEGSSDGAYVTLASNGNTAVYLRRGGSNWGFYVGAGNANAGVNTWVSPGVSDRILLTYNATTYRMKYYLGDPATGVYAMRGNYFVSSAIRTNNTVDGVLKVGDGVDSGIVTGQHWDGGLNNMIISDHELTGPQIAEYFQSGEQYDSNEFYDDVTTWSKFGEDVYPNVTDVKGNATQGALINGTESDFADVPEV
jgi:hypothetical protein|tara:strand:- start:5931 stop:6893 length:963 start_codon:yes stop_codon:yes gene_type:complete